MSSSGSSCAAEEEEEKANAETESVETTQFADPLVISFFSHLLIYLSFSGVAGVVPLCIFLGFSCTQHKVK